MDRKEDYFRFTKKGSVHKLCDRIPFRGRELIIWTVTSTVFLFWLMGPLIGAYILVLSMVGYLLFRMAAWYYYSEVLIDEDTGQMRKVNKLLNKVLNEEIITNEFVSDNVEFMELSRSGKTKYLMRYNTYKNHDLIILRSQHDKELIEGYIKTNLSQVIIKE